MPFGVSLANGGYSVGYESFAFDDNRSDANGALGSAEARKSPNYQVSAWMADALDEDFDYSLLGYYEDHNPSDVVAGSTLDDSMASAAVLQTSIFKQTDNNTLVGVGLSYAIQAEKESVNSTTEEINFTIAALDLSMAKQVGKTTYLATLGYYKNLSADKDSGGSTQRHTDDTTYVALAVDYEHNQQFDFGGSIASFDGDGKREGYSDEPGKEAIFYDLYTRYKMSDYQLRVGYINRDFDDKDDNEWLKGDGVYATLEVPFGAGSDKKETMLVTQKPQFWKHHGIASGPLE